MMSQSSPLGKLKLPEIHKPSASTLKSYSLQNSPGKNNKIPKTQMLAKKPMYVAKKVDEDDLFGDTFKGNLLGLSQIQEEKFAEDDSFPVLRVETEEDKEQSPTPNIFQNDLLASSKFKESNRGPRYNNAEQIIRHTICGAPEIYERYQKKLQRGQTNNNVKMQDQELSFNKESMSEPSSVNRTQTVKPLGSSLMENQSSSYLHQVSSMGAVSKKQFQGEKKKEANRQKDLIISRDDLLREIDKMKDRQDSFYMQERERFNSLPLGDQLHLTKDARILERYQSVLQEWDYLIRLYNKKIQRDPGQSVALRGEHHRRKKEMADAFEAVKTDFEKLGSVYWMVSLRKYEKPKKFDGKSETIDSSHDHYRSGDLPHAFSTSFLTKKEESGVEIIRKPSDTSSFVSGICTNRKIDRTEREYLELKINQHEKILSQLRPVVDDTSDLVVTKLFSIYFKIIGTSKLKTEIESVLMNNPKRDVYAVPKSFLISKT